MFRSALRVVYVPWVVLSFSVTILPVVLLVAMLSAAGGTKAQPNIHALITVWSKWWLFLIGMPVKVVSPLPPKGTYIIIANHISYLDSIVLFSAINGHFKALGKMEIAGIPLVGFLYRQIAILIDRSSAASRAQSMKKMLEALQSGCSIVLFPEGTFNETDQPLLPFHDGAFRLAATSGVPLLPLVVPDTVNRWHYSAWWKFSPGVNRAFFLSSVTANGTTPTELRELKRKVSDDMAAALQTLRVQ
jgi:1-acyl-sn-glycerol-3-phosphate acyltransferase